MADFAPVIKLYKRYPASQNDLLYAIFYTLNNLTSMAAPTVIQFEYYNSTNDLLANILLLLQQLFPGFLSPGTTSFTIPPNVIMDNILIIAPTTPLTAFTIGTTPGGDDVLLATPVGTRQLIQTPVDGGDTGVTIYFGGIASDTIIKPFLR